jgi:hypothetical protein
MPAFLQSKFPVILPGATRDIVPVRACLILSESGLCHGPGIKITTEFTEIAEKKHLIISVDSMRSAVIDLLGLSF